MYTDTNVYRNADDEYLLLFENKKLICKERGIRKKKRTKYLIYEDLRLCIYGSRCYYASHKFLIYK